MNTCPKCGSSEYAQTPDIRIYFRCDSYGYKDKEKFDLVYRSELCLEREEKNILQRKVKELQVALDFANEAVDQREAFRILHVASAFQKSIEVLGSLDKARRWFTSPKKALGGKTPLEFCATDIGAEEVCNLLGRIEHGIFA